MSDSSIALKPVIDDPSKPIPSSSAPSTSLVVIEKLFRWPSMSVNHRSTSSTPRSLICFRTSFRVSGSDVARFLLSTCTMSPPRSTGSESTPVARLPSFSMVEGSLARLAALVSQRRRAVFVVWIALLAGGGWFSLHQNDHLSGGGWEVPGSPSLRVTDAVQHDFPRVRSPVFTVFVRGGDVPRRLAQVHALLAREPDVEPGPPLVRGGAALLAVSYSGKSSNAIDEATRLRHLLVDPTTKVVGEPAIWSNFQTVSKQQLARGESL